jgi:formylglycine-generating enzyme required for sulfatase activity
MAYKQFIQLIIYSIIVLNFTVEAQEKQLVFVEGGYVNYKNKRVFVNDFEISKFEITNTEYALFLNTNTIDSSGLYNGIQIINTNSTDLQLEYQNNMWLPKKGKANFPMVMVNYYGALAYANWAKGKLPTEIEWHYAAIGGVNAENFIYAGSNNLDEVGWYSKNSNGHSSEVGKKKPNQLGVFDMSGNVWEWCLNDTLKADSDFCLHMGGSWFAEKQPSSILANYGNTPLHFSNSVGFRVLFTSEKN